MFFQVSRGAVVSGMLDGIVPNSAATATKPRSASDDGGRRASTLSRPKSSGGKTMLPMLRLLSVLHMVSDGKKYEANYFWIIINYISANFSLPFNAEKL